MIHRARGAVQGIVQGVGFRPFVYQLARALGLSGFVENTAQGVRVEVQGPLPRIHDFFQGLASHPPPLAQVASVSWEEIPPAPEEGFVIHVSSGGEERTTLISPDVGTCEDCLRELRNPADRRYRYPFINCTNCGPRYTIIEDIPYDRAQTTMRVFAMCEACGREYEDPSDRRFHAQPNACPDCGPRVSLRDQGGKPIPCGDPVAEAVRLLSMGRILAVKGLGGFHLAVDAGNHDAVVELRERKHREEKPLAVMVRDMEAARGLAHLTREEEGLLLSPARPIVLLAKREGHGLSPQISPCGGTFGIMLPYTPLHHLLLEGPYRALVMTSGNRSDEPITVTEGTAFAQLSGIADVYLCHDREIHLRTDDSVLRMVGGNPRQIRRSRGFVPAPLTLAEAWKALPPVLAVGGELKNTVCLTKENRAFVSQHIGDLKNFETYEAFERTIAHLVRILDIRPEIVAHDLHPDYLSTRHALEQSKRPTLGVQHHHAHIVSCLAEHGLEGPVIGIALDGTGWGPDGTVWGGEVLLADPVSYARTAFLERVPLPGGDAAARYPWRMALAYLDGAFGEGIPDLPIPFVAAHRGEEARTVLHMLHRGLNAPLTSSCGRLFDAVASLLGLRDRNAFEGQAAMELEEIQEQGDFGVYPWSIEEGEGGNVLVTRNMVRGIVEDLCSGVPRGVISRRFHDTLVRLLTETCLLARKGQGISDVVLSGGCFQNTTLLTRLTRALEGSAFRVFSQARVPANDGGLSLGQALCAAMRLAGRKGRYSGYEIRR